MERKPWPHRVQYYETDQMAVVHHSNYIRWFEEARVNWLEQMDLPVQKIEKMGILIPVVSCSAKYRISALLGDTVEISTQVKKYNGVVLEVSYEVRRPASDELLATGETSHCFTTRDGKILNLKHKYPEIHAILAAE